MIILRALEETDNKGKKDPESGPTTLEPSSAASRTRNTLPFPFPLLECS